MEDMENMITHTGQKASLQKNAHIDHSATNTMSFFI